MCEASHIETRSNQSLGGGAIGEYVFRCRRKVATG